jgi:NADH-quinone oxidoreductase subunit K
MMSSVPLPAFLLLGAILFAIGVVGVATRRNVLVIFMSVELMMNAVNLTFVAFASFFQQLDGQIFVFFILVVAAAEVAVGLAIIVAIFRNRETVDVTDMNILKG